MFKVPESKRITMENAHRLPGRAWKLATAPHEGLYGGFYVDGPCGRSMLCIASNGEHWEEQGLTGMPWEHVSVSLPNRAPNWEEMNFVKRLFWDDEDCVIQFHPPRSEYVNVHPNCLHMWRPVGIELPRPPSITVGPQAVAR